MPDINSAIVLPVLVPVVSSSKIVVNNAVSLAVGASFIAIVLIETVTGALTESPSPP